MTASVKLVLLTLCLLGFAVGCQQQNASPQESAESSPASSSATGQPSLPVAVETLGSNSSQDLAELKQRVKTAPPTVKREIGKKLGELLQESWKPSAESPAVTAEQRMTRQKEILEQLSLLGALAIDAVPFLTAILQGDAPLDLQSEVLQTATHLGTTGKRMGPALAEASRNPELQAKAIQALIQLRCDDSASVIVLGEALRSAESRDQALNALLQLEGKQLMPASRFLLEIAAASDLHVTLRIAAMEVIAKFNSSALAELYFDKELEIRKAVARLGAVSGSRLAIEQNRDVIQATFQGLARPPIEPVKLAEVFNQALKVESLRQDVYQFFQAHPEKFVPTLIELFKSDSVMIRDYAVDTLADLEPSSTTIAGLQEVLQKENDLGIVALASVKLGEVPALDNKEDFAEYVSKWISHPKLQRHALDLLRKLGNSAAKVCLQLVLQEGLDFDAKAQLLDSISQDATQVTWAREQLQEQLKTQTAGAQQQWLRMAWLRVLPQNEMLPIAELSPALKEILKGEDVTLLRLTLQSLSAHHRLIAELIPELLGLIQHTSAGVRISVLQTLGKLEPTARSSDVINAVKKLSTDDPDPAVKQQALECLKRLETQ